ncbi:MAG TPA: ABC transporter ATP-binding protein [Methanosarcina sp.]
MTLTEIIDTLKFNFNPSKVIISFEKTIGFYNESDNASKGNNIRKGLENNPYSDSVGDSVKSSSTVNISQNGVSPFIKLENVWKTYKMGDTEFAALAGINLEINEGEFLVILGPSGSGKSTLMNLIGCLDLPSKGTIYLDSKNIANLAESELARIRGEMIGFIFQSFNLIPTLNTEENIMLPMEFQEANMNEGRKRAEYLLRIVGLSDKIQNLPSQLSGGQMQRVAIARSLAVNPPIILADEPTGNLDTKGNYILDFLNGLHEREGKTIIIVTHDLDIIKYATRVVYIRDGKIERIEKRTKNEPEELK